MLIPPRLREDDQALGKIRRRPRQYQRVAVRCGCWLEHEGATVFGNTIDVGRGGLFLRTALPMNPGSGVLMTLSLPGAQAPIVAEGEIVHRVLPLVGDQKPGLGVRFLRITSGETVLERFLGSTLEETEGSDG